MRWLMIVALAACGGGASSCPPAQVDGVAGAPEGEACDGTATCFVEDTFSSCASGWYTCVDHKWHFDHGIDPVDGASCASTPLAGCSTEGNGCGAEPTAAECGCGSDGTWTCTCSCYNAYLADCDCPATYRDLSGIGCGGDCPYPDGHTCTCVKASGSDEYGTFACH